MLLLALRDLQYRRWRVALAVALMAIVMTLLFLMAGLVEQFNREPVRATDSVGGDRVWVVAEGTGGPFTSPRPVDRAAFEAVGGDPVLVAPSALARDQVRVVGRSYASYEQTDEPVLTTGRYPMAPGEIVVDESAGRQVGDRATLGGLPVSVVGTTSDATVLAGVPLVFTTLEFGQHVAVDGRDMVVAVLSDDPPPLPPELRSLTPEAVAADALVPLDGAISSVDLVRALLWLITLIIIAAISYITALERTRDFAVLKAVGARTRGLAGSLILQAVIMAFAAVGIAGLLQRLIAPSFPLRVSVPTSAWLTITGGALLAALAASCAGVLKIRATSASEAFG